MKLGSLVLLGALSGVCVLGCSVEPSDAIVASSQALAQDASTGSSDAGAAVDGATPALVVDVGGATGMAFAPKEATIHVGASVRFQWGNGRHNVVSGTVEGGHATADGKFCNPGGATCAQAPARRGPFAFDQTFTEPGDYPYFCTPHVPMGMTGVIHVVR